ncbi:MAG: hypothetical protein AAF492_33350, partial [Verrucomicrobiota bacterium]
EILAEHPKDSAERRKLASRIKLFVTGYSLYEVDGRFMGSSGPVDERVWVIRLIMHDPESEEGIGPQFRKVAESIVEKLIGKRFAEELGTEDEIWMLEYHKPSLIRWIRKDEPT